MTSGRTSGFRRRRLSAEDEAREIAARDARRRGMRCPNKHEMGLRFDGKDAIGAEKWFCVICAARWTTWGGTST